MSTVFRWLHLSDIHYMVDPDTGRTQDIILDKLRECCSVTYVNCIVITGDFFQQGQYQSNGSNDRHNCIAFLKDVCSICLPPVLRDNWKDYIIFCPGNHDIDRGATLTSETIKSILTRKKVLKNAASTSQHRMLETGSEQYRLLTNNTFWLYQKAICGEIQSDSIGDYEYRIFEKTSDDNQRIVFVSINTALYAGQTREINEIKKDLFECRKYLQEADNQNYPDSNYTKPEEEYKNYLRLHRELINGEANDKGKLCFISIDSEDALKDVLDTIRNRNALSPVYIFLGHHPLSWLSEEAKKEFAKLAEQYSPETIIYLCGHEHRPAVHTTRVEYNGTDSINVLELEVGGDFADPAHWNVPSFSIDEIKFEDDGAAHLAGKIFWWCRYLEHDSIEFALNLKHEYGWQEVAFGGRDRIYLRTARAADVTDRQKKKPSETSDDSEKTEETINYNKIDTDKGNEEETTEPYYDTPQFGDIDF